MAFCINCGYQLVDGAKFCFECGTKINIHSAPQETQRKIVFDGELHKCPNCGELINSFELYCPSCSHEFRGTKVKSSVSELGAKLEEIEANRGPKKTHTLTDEFFGTYGRFSTEDEQKINLIRNFSIPNTKEDILEFMILASSNIDIKLYGTENHADKTGSQRAISDAWISKFEQAYQKANFSFSDHPIFYKIQTIYSEKINAIEKEKKKKARDVNMAMFICFFMIIILSVILPLILSLST